MTATRTVRDDLTVKFDGGVFVPRGQFDRDLLEQWKGKRVEVAERDFWGTQLYCAIHLPCLNVMQQAVLYLDTSR